MSSWRPAATPPHWRHWFSAVGAPPPPFSPESLLWVPLHTDLWWETAAAAALDFHCRHNGLTRQSNSSGFPSWSHKQTLHELKGILFSRGGKLFHLQDYRTTFSQMRSKLLWKILKPPSGNVWNGSVRNISADTFPPFACDSHLDSRHWHISSASAPAPAQRHASTAVTHLFAL